MDIYKSSLAALPKRPPLGNIKNKLFTPTSFISNYFAAKTTTKIVHIYSIQISPEISHDNRLLINTLLSENRKKIDHLLGSKSVFAGRCIFSTGDPILHEKAAVEVMHEQIVYTITIARAKTFRLDEIGNTSEKTASMLSFLNNTLKNVLRDIGFNPIGRTNKYFKGSAREKIPNCELTLYRGYEASFCLRQSGLLLLANSANKLVRSSSVLSTINDTYTLHRGNTKQQKRAFVQEALGGKTVMANYGTNQYWIVSEVIYDLDLQKFEITDSEFRRLTLIEYYKVKYNLTINNLKQPLLKCFRNRRKPIENQGEGCGKTWILLIPEFCLMTGIPELYDERKRMEISKLTIRPPQDRVNASLNLIKQLAQSSKTSTHRFRLIDLETLGITIQKTLLRVRGERMATPVLQLGQNQSIQKGRQSSFQLFNKKLYDTAQELILQIVMFRFPLQQVVDILSSTCKSFGLVLRLQVKDLGTFDNQKSPVLLQNYLQGSTIQERFMWFILPPHAKSLYKTIKTICLFQKGVLSQVCLENRVNSKATKSIVTKIILQMASKIGNIPWLPSCPPASRTIMMLGIDSAAMGRKQSIVAYCCTTNQNFSRFCSGIIRQNQSCSMSEVIGDIVLKCVASYQKVNGMLVPEIVLVLRQGRSEGQKKVMIENEAVGVKRVLTEIGMSIGKQGPKLLFMSIDKRPSQKFFEERENQISNPAPGSLVRQGVVSAQEFDFYMIAQQVSGRATASPVYCQALFNDTDLTEDYVNYLMYSQCFNYMNWTGSVRVPAVLQYASKLAKFRGQCSSIEGELANQKLEYELYYI